MRWTTTIACTAFILACPIANGARAEDSVPGTAGEPEIYSDWIDRVQEQWPTMTPAQRFESVIVKEPAFRPKQWPLPYPDIWAFDVPLPAGTVIVNPSWVSVDNQGDVVVTYFGYIQTLSGDRHWFLRYYSFVRQAIVLDLRMFNSAGPHVGIWGGQDEEIGFFPVPNVGHGRGYGGAPLPDGTYLRPASGYFQGPKEDIGAPDYYFSEHVTADGHVLSRPMLVWIAPGLAPLEDPRFRVATQNYELHELGDGTYLLAPPAGSTTWFRVRPDLSSPILDASKDHLRLEQPVFKFMRAEAYAVAQAMARDARRRGRPRVDVNAAADFHLLLEIKRVIQLRKRS